jgi:hypothetical protein
MVTGKNGSGQVIEVLSACPAPIPLPVGLNPVRPADFTHGFPTFPLVHQSLYVDHSRRIHQSSCPFNRPQSHNPETEQEPFFKYFIIIFLFHYDLIFSKEIVMYITA